MNNKLGLYIHIPFCEKKCRYCGFLSFADYDDEIYEKYTKALCREIESYNEGFASAYVPDTIFIGGGTPSLMSPERITRILESIFRTFIISDDAEITIESNPNSLTGEKLDAYRKAGINRLSIGAQSMDDRILDSLGRVHKTADVLHAYDMARAAGFKNINIDLMFAVPGQSIFDVTGSLQQVIKMRPEHISLYGLQLEEDTVFYEEYKSGIIDIPDERTEREMYHESLAILRKAGYEHYEISNCCLKGYECRHNLKYWNLENYLGAGLGAHSYIGGSRYNNVCEMDRYLDLTEEKGNAADPASYHNDTESDAMGVYAFTALRKRRGIDLLAFEKRFGRAFFTVYRDKADIIKKYIDEGLMNLSGSSLSLTEKGIDVSNDIMCEFV